MGERLLTVKEVAERYGLSEDFVYGCRGLRQYRQYEGRSIFFLESDLREFEASRPKNRGYDLSPAMQEIIRQRSLKQRKAQAKAKLRFDFI